MDTFPMYCRSSLKMIESFLHLPHVYVLDVMTKVVTKLEISSQSLHSLESKNKKRRILPLITHASRYCYRMLN